SRRLFRAENERAVLIADALGIAARGVDGKTPGVLVARVDDDGDELVLQHDAVADAALQLLRAGRCAACQQECDGAQQRDQAATTSPVASVFRHDAPLLVAGTNPSPAFDELRLRLPNRKS